MKYLKKVIVLPLMIGLVLACGQKNEIKLDRVTELTNQVVSSIQFTSLQIKLSDLNLAGSQYVDVEKNSIAIPFVGRDARKGLVAIFDEDDGLKGVMEFEALTTVAPNQIYTELKNGRFNGTFVFRMGMGKISLQLENSKVISSVMARMDGSTIAFKKCDATSALDCARAKIEQMNWFDWMLCNLEFIVCLTREVIKCVFDGCNNDYFA
jgi:hypothetical protein